MFQTTARAHANIALIKYWGKIPSLFNLPATSSLSLTLDAFFTETTVSLNSEADSLVLNGNQVSGIPLIRISKFVEKLRVISGRKEFASIFSTNNFPTASGLASSASGFAALALAATRAYDISCTQQELSVLAREGSGSAARSIFGSYCYLPAGNLADPSACYAQPIDAHPSLSLSMIVAQCAVGEKSISSRDAMKITASTSPFFDSFVTANEKSFAQACNALRDGDFNALGTCMEHSTLSMHASMLAAQPSIFYLNDTSLSCINLIKKLRMDGIACFFTIDAGPHVKVLCHAHEAAMINRELMKISGVIKTTIAHPGPAATAKRWPSKAPGEHSEPGETEYPSYVSALKGRHTIDVTKILPPLQGSYGEARNHYPGFASSPGALLGHRFAVKNLVDSTNTISAPGKAVLWGEYAVLEKHSAVVAALSQRVYCSKTPAHEISFSAPNQPTCTLEDTNTFFSLAHQVIDTASAKGLMINPAHYHFDSSALHTSITPNIKLGLGSSAAIAASLAAHIIVDNFRELDAKKIFMLAYEAHKKFSDGYGSGIDIAAAVYGGTLTFPEIHPIDIKTLSRAMLFVYAGKNQATKNYLKKVAAFKENNPTKYRENIKQLAHHNHRINHAAQNKDVDAVIIEVDRLNPLLLDFGHACGIEIISAEHQKIHAIAKRFHGAAKPSGAGGGDVSMCIVREELLSDLRRALENEGFCPLDISFDNNQGILISPFEKGG